MVDSYLEFRRALVQFLWATCIWLGIATLIWLMPKDMASGAHSRFILVSILAATMVIGAGALPHLFARLRQTYLRMAMFESPGPIQTTVQYLLSERRDAMQGLRPAFLIGVAMWFAYILLAWPQLADYTAWRPLTGWLSLASFFVMSLLAILNRTSWINILFLRRCLSMQVSYARFKPKSAFAAWQQYRALRGPTLRRTRKGVQAAGMLWTWEEVFARNIFICGAIGSGKTLTVIRLLYEIPFLLFGNKFSSLVYDVKGSEVAAIESLCREYDRDCFVFRLDGDPAAAGEPGSIILSAIDHDAPALEAADALVAAAKAIGLKTNETFFLDNLRIILTAFIEVLRAGLPENEYADIRHLNRLMTEPMPEETVTEDGEIVLTQGAGSLMLDLMARIAAHYDPLQPLPVGLDQGITYIQGPWKSMPDRQRAAIVGTFSQVAGDLLSEPVCHFVCGRSTVTMPELLEGRIMVLHIPQARYPRASKVLNALFGSQHKGAVLRAVAKPVPSISYLDEYQSLMVSGSDGDSRWYSLSRESNHSSVCAAQNIDLLRQVGGAHDTPAILGNLATSIWLRNASSPDTAEVASRLIGETENITVSQSETAQLSGLFRRHRTSYSRSSAKARLVPASALSNLAVPVKDDPARHYSEAIVHVGGDAKTHHRRLLFKVHRP